MKLSELSSANQLSMWIVPVDDTAELTTGLVTISPSSAPGEFHVEQHGFLYRVRPQSVKGGLGLSQGLHKGCARLAHISQTTKTRAVLLIVHFFNGPLIEMGEIKIWLDDKVKTFGNPSLVDGGTVQRLTQNCVIDVNENQNVDDGEGGATDVDHEHCFLIMSGAAASEDEDSQSQVADELTHFAIVAPEVKIPVSRKSLPGQPEIFVASRLISRGFNLDDGCLRLAKGRLMFTTSRHDCVVRPLASGTVERLIKQQGSYLRRWDEYGEIEGEMLLKQARAVGQLTYRAAKKSGANVKFFFDQPLPQALSEVDQIELATQLPPYLSDTDMSWSAYCNLLFKPGEDGAEVMVRDQDSVVVPIARLTEDELELPLELPPKKDHFLVLSINGDKTQVERRAKAREMVLKERCAIPWLGAVIEQGGEPPIPVTAGHIKPLSPFVKEKIFDHPPNEAQIAAIDKALNTPDICLIQGPPGTGKTTVITAIIERLNELQEKSSSVKGQILVSGFQHDAVENIASRLRVNALPSIKFGRRSGQNDNLIDQQLRQWCADLTEKVRRQNPQVQQSEQQRQLAVLFHAYLTCPSQANAKSLLSSVVGLPADVLPQSLHQKASRLLSALTNNELGMNTERQLALHKVRALRVSQCGFLDDGNDRASDVLETLEDKLDKADIKLLRRAVVYRSSQLLDFLPSLKQLKKTLLLRLASQPQFRLTKPNQAIIELIAEVQKQLELHKTTSDKKQNILAEYLHELQSNPDGAKDSIAEYHFVYAATTQQSVGKDIRLVKTSSADESIQYDTVIIDEAARVSPRDLLIPMVQAANRIILVGDHRQLPHIIDQQVAQQLEDENADQADTNVDDLVEQSMFKYLFERLKKLEKIDKVCRTVTLNAQYRTHPLLGHFISDQFYHPYGEAFDSPLNSQAQVEKRFTHHLPTVEKQAAVWLDVPNNQGPEQKTKSKSRFRQAEVEAIAEKLAQWMDSEAGQELTFAVISFYKAQVEALYKALVRYGITYRAADGSWQITEQYQSLSVKKDGKTQTHERFRIGTVDAFQGMEFDIVFLSVVRTQNWSALPKWITRHKEPKRRAKMLYGHLMSPNRLCVSMSRQKKLLLVAGDAQMVKQNLAREYVPQLGAFYDLCSREGKLL